MAKVMLQTDPQTNTVIVGKTHTHRHREEQQSVTGWSDEGLTEWDNGEILHSQQRSGVSDNHMTAFPNPGPKLTCSMFKVLF